MVIQSHNNTATVDWALPWPLIRIRIASLHPVDQEQLKNEAVLSVHEVNDLSWRRDINYFHAKRTVQGKRPANHSQEATGDAAQNQFDRNNPGASA